MSIAEVPLIVRALTRNRVIASILLVQVLVATACVTNLAFLLSERLGTLTYKTGLEEANLGVIETEYLGPAAANPAASIRTDLEAIRQQPGVEQVIAAESLPLAQHNWSAGFTNKPLEGDDLSGISQALADKLFPEGGAVGKFLYADAQHPIQVVGIVKTLSRPVLKTDADNDMSLILPLIPDGPRVMFAIRAADGRVADVIASSEATLSQRDANRTIARSTSFRELRADYFRHDQTMAIMFLSSGLALLVVTATGVYGLASFWVRKRYRQIGIRRALGARKSDILRYFLVENLILTATGSVVGTVLAIGLNMAVARYYEVARIEAPFLAIGVLTVLLLGQAAAFVPARRAAKEAPVAILRSA